MLPLFWAILFSAVLSHSILSHVRKAGALSWLQGSSLRCSMVLAAKASGKCWILCDCSALWSHRLDWLPRKPECRPKITILRPRRKFMRVWSVITARCYLFTQECILSGGLPDYPPHGFTSNFLQKEDPVLGRGGFSLPNYHCTHSCLAHTCEALLLMLSCIWIRLHVRSSRSILILDFWGFPPTLAYYEEWFWW